MLSIYSSVPSATIAPDDLSLRVHEFSLSYQSILRLSWNRPNSLFPQDCVGASVGSDSLAEMTMVASFLSEEIGGLNFFISVQRTVAWYPKDARLVS